MSKTLVLMFGVWACTVGTGLAADKTESLPLPKRMPGTNQAEDKSESLSMPKPVAGADPAHDSAASQAEGHEGRCGGVRGCMSRFREWLCYRAPEPPVKMPLCNGHPCCHPQLHTFFLHRCGACVPPDDGQGYPITFSYTALLERNGDGSSCGCRGCK